MRGGHLDRIDYGTRVDPDASTGTDTTFSGHPAARVSFGYADRCLSSCATHDGTHWTDTPWDLNCGASTCNNGSPTFWATSRLASVTTQVWDGSANYRNVEQWTLTHTYPDPGDGTRPGLWLAKVSHAGLVGTTTALPDITFGGVQLNNRVDTLDGSPAMNWWRMTEINTETGGRISVAYSAPDCVARTRVPSVPQSNALRCYPVRWTPAGNTSAITDYFHKYVVSTVTETDLTGGAPRTVHNYTYLGDPAWHYTDDDGLIDPDNKTWSQWRGYARVGTSVGDPGEQTYSESLFLRGMNGDHLPSGTRSVTVTDSQGGTVGDEDAYAGAVRESQVFNGPGGAEISGVINDPWQSAATATRPIDGVAARYVNTQGTHNRTTLDGGRGVRRTSTHTDFDAYGVPVRVTDFGDDATSGDEQCAKTTYEPRNTDAWLMSYPQRAQTFALTCDQVDAGPLSSADIIGDGRTSYDGQAPGTAPIKGDVTAVDQMSNWSGGTTTYLTVSKSGYDTNGRILDSWDVLNNHSSTAYTPATGGPVTKVVDTNPKLWTTTTTLEPAWGTALSTVDVNGRRTDMSYDGLGRLTAAWLPGRVKGTDTADYTYAYLIRTNGAVAVTGQSLNPNGGYVTSYTLYDGLLRPRQTQTASPSGGRLLTDTFYDTAGRTVKAFAPYYATGVPGQDLVGPTDITTVPKQTRTTYDGAGRPIASIFQPYNVERWRTSTYYGGDHADVTPPAGGTPSSTIVDARGRKVEARQYHGSAASGAYDATTYTYNRQGLLAGVTDPAGDHWAYTYDIRGRQTRVDDPDKGATTSTYDDAARLTSTTDSRGSQLTVTYDTLNRKTALYQGTASGTKLAAWTYDATFMTDNVTVAKGQLSSATRYVGSAAYKVATDAYTDHYEPRGSTITIPASETGLAGSYDFRTYYNPDGSLNTVNLPQTGDVALESLGYHYTDLGLPSQLTTFYNVSDPQSSYVSAAEYDALAQPTSYTLYTGWFSNKGGRVYQGFVRELETGRLTHISTTRDSANPNTVFDAQYTYDNAGNVTQITDAPPLGTADTQCFGYDYLRRLSQAWTPSSGSCTAAPTAAGLGGPAKYWQSWTYDLVGDRQSQVEHATATGDVTTAYTYPGPAAGQPHTLTGTSTTDSTGTKTASYAYDTAGNTTSRPAPTSGSQTLSWDAEGHLAGTSDASGTVSYLYDADGNRLIRTDATGKTLYLPGEELRYTTATAAKTCTRYYSFGSGTVAQRTAAGITWLAGDQQGTAQLAIDANTQAVTQRRQTPFGGSRGTQVTWPSEKGFVGGTADPSGLIQLGARAYDSGLGRFVSVDPVMDLSDPQQMSGYAYAADTPVTSSDPSGMMWTDNGGNFTANPGPISQAPNTGNDNGGGGGGGGGNSGGNSGGGGQHKKSCGTFDLSCHASQAFHKAVNFVDDHKAIIAGIAVGVVVGLGCEATFGVVTAGAGSVACAAAAGAAGSMTDYAISTKVEHKGEFSWSGLLVNGAIGGAAGALTAGIGLVAGPALKAGAAALAARVGLKGAVQAGGRAAGAEARRIAAGAVRGLGGGSARKGESQGVSRVLESCHSFAPDTRVVMADGSSAAIKDVRVGQKVVATDPVSGRNVVEPVTALHLNRDTDLADVSVGTAGGVTVLHTTQHHPFWDQTIKQWVDAGKLVAGHRLRVLALAVAVVVIGVHTFTGQQEMRDLTVAQVHTYYVLAGDTQVLVHNCGTADYAGRNRSPDTAASSSHAPPHELDIDVRSHRAPTIVDRAKLEVIKLADGLDEGDQIGDAIDNASNIFPNLPWYSQLAAKAVGFVLRRLLGG
jgi:RHS repeat-associated protein